MVVHHFHETERLLHLLNRNAIRALPKCELHRHLDGSVRLETIAELAAHHNLDLGCSDAELAERATIGEPMNNLQEVLQSFSITQKVLCSYDAIKRVAFVNVEDAFRDGVKLLELRFAPPFISAGKNDLGNDEIIEAVLDGIDQGMEKYSIQVGLIGIIPRPFDYSVNHRATEDLIRYARGGYKHAERICGFDLADDELKIAHEEFVTLINRAASAGLGITVHTGENTDARCVKKSMDLYKPRRIGHGIQAMGDDSLLNRMRDEGIMLELCPTSNWLTHSVSSIEEHPLPLFYRRGIPLSINSDDPRLMNIDLVHEYEICARYYGLGSDDFKKINREAVSHSFLSNDIRKEVLKTCF